jgi:aromatic-L-amino-acid decarboxylase
MGDRSVTVEEIARRIRTLEAAARRLEPGPKERRRWRDAVLAYAERFLERLPELRAYDGDSGRARRIRETPFTDGPAEWEEILATLAECVDGTGINPASGGHLGYIPGGGLPISAWADFLADVTNRYAGVRFAGPGAVELEQACLDWMAELVGYPRDAGGNLTSGGSISNLIAIVTARDARGIRAADVPRAAVYLTAQAHHSIEKALRIAGLGECVVRRVPMDDRYRMRPEALEATVREDRAAGLRPWLVCTAAGTTDVGAVDPLDEVGAVAERHGLWHHVDAAYGGFFLLVDEMRPKLAGIARSDSVILDPHKTLFLPYGSGAVLVRDREAMRRAHGFRAAYLQDAAAAESADAPSPAELAPELTKPFRGLRLWLALKVHGLAPFRAALEEKLWLARYAYEELRRLGFEVGPEPELSVVAFRWVPRRGDPEAFNRRLLDAIHRDGRIFLSSTTLDGRFMLRLAIVVFRTHLETVELALQVLREKVTHLEGA